MEAALLALLHDHSLAYWEEPEEGGVKKARAVLLRLSEGRMAGELDGGEK